MSYQVSLNYDTRLPYIKPSTLSTLSAQQKNIDSSLPSCGSGAGIIIFVAVTQEAPSKQLLPRKETASLRRQTTGRGGGRLAPGNRQTRVEENLQEEGEGWEEGALKTRRKDLPRHQAEKV